MRYVKAIRVAPEDTEKIQNILGMTAKERKEYPPEDITYNLFSQSCRIFHSTSL